MTLNKKCLQGLHPLKSVYIDSDGFVQNVVRWCPECGAIVIDVDCDSRTYPGRVMKMKLPQAILNSQKEDYRETLD